LGQVYLNQNNKIGLLYKKYLLITFGLIYLVLSIIYANRMGNKLMILITKT